MRFGPPLEEREKAVLASVVRNYVGTAAPVGSKKVAEETGLRCSSATIRAVMGRMEERGLMKQPHTSAGRIPTDRGYRVFVDEILERASPRREVQEKVVHGVARIAPRPDQVPGSVSALLGTLAGPVGFATPPRLDGGVFRSLFADPLGERRVAVVLTLEPGLVRSSVCELDEPIEGRTLASGLDALNRRFSGCTVRDVREELFGPGWEARVPPTPVGNLFRRAAEDLLETGHDRALSVSGLEAMYEQPEFRDRSGLEPLAALLREREAFTRQYEHGLPREETALWIGSENEREELRRFSVVASRYRFGPYAGIMGIVGPTRMEYGRALELIDFLRRVVWFRIGPPRED